MADLRRQRMPGIDVWRAVLMLFGIAYHGTMLRPQDLPFFRVIVLVSQSCRMGLFFALSGFLAAYALQRREPLFWLKDRLVSLGIVTAFGLAVICPLTTLAALIAPEAGRIEHGFPQWYHIWFLVALLLYTPAAYLLNSLNARYCVIGKWESDERSMRYAQPLLLLVIPLISLCLMISGALLVQHLTPALFWFALMQVRPAMGYVPLFLMGFIIARSPRLRHELTKSATLPAIILAIVGTSYLAWHVYSPALLSGAERQARDPVVLGIGSAICPPAMMLLMLRSAQSIRRTPPVLKRLADASFTIYLVHMPIVIAINGMFVWVSW